MVQLEIRRRLETLKRTIRSSEQSAIEILNANLGQGFAKGRFCHKIKLCEVRSISKKSSIFSKGVVRVRLLAEFPQSEETALQPVNASRS